MSYYFGIVLNDSLLFGCDRTFNDKMTGESRSDSKRYSILGNNRVFLPTGNLPFCVKIQNVLHSAFEFSLEAFDGEDFCYSEMLSSDYQKAKEDDKARLHGIGKTAYTETDCLYGGLDDGAPFIIIVSSTDDFQLKLIDKPIQYVCLNQTPEILAFVTKFLKVFVGATADQGTDEIWNLGRKFLPSIIQKISKADPLVSLSGDLIFVSKGGVQTYEFGEGMSNGVKSHEKGFKASKRELSSKVKGWGKG
jgi:hypothetical protein